MSEHQNGIQSALGVVGKLFEDIALLLKTAESQMGEAGWEQYGSNSATAETSTHINNPRRWMPRYAFRFLVNPECPGVLAFASVILDRHREPKLVPQPLASAGLLNYEGSEIGRWEYWFARIHLWMPGRVDDGTLISAARDRIQLKDAMYFAKATTLALPLVEITDSDEVRAKLVAPLLSAV